MEKQEETARTGETAEKVRILGYGARFLIAAETGEVTALPQGTRIVLPGSTRRVGPGMERRYMLGHFAKLQRSACVVLTRAPLSGQQMRLLLLLTSQLSRDSQRVHGARGGALSLRQTARALGVTPKSAENLFYALQKRGVLHYKTENRRAVCELSPFVVTCGRSVTSESLRAFASGEFFEEWKRMDGAKTPWWYFEEGHAAATCDGADGAEWTDGGADCAESGAGRDG